MSAAPVPGSEPTILVVDDNEMLRVLTVKILSAAGYRVLAAQDGPEAVALFRRHSTAIDLVLLDAVMPDMNGWETFEQMRSVRAGVPAVFMSGHIEMPVPECAAQAEALPFLSKPYAPRDLIAAIRNALEASSA